MQAKLRGEYSGATDAAAGAAGERNGKRGQSSNIAFPHDCNEKQRWLNVLDLAVCALLRSARRSPIQIFDD